MALGIKRFAALLSLVGAVFASPQVIDFGRIDDTTHNAGEEELAGQAEGLNMMDRMCRVWDHSATVVDSNLYIYGGRALIVNNNDDGSNVQDGE